MVWSVCVGWISRVYLESGYSRERRPAVAAQQPQPPQPKPQPQPQPLQQPQQPAAAAVAAAAAAAAAGAARRTRFQLPSSFWRTCLGPMREAFSQTGWMTFTVLVPEQKRAGICLVGGVRAKSVVESVFSGHLCLCRHGTWLQLAGWTPCVRPRSLSKSREACRGI